MSCCIAATPLAPDYLRYLEPIQYVDVERLPRLPAPAEMGRVGRQVVVICLLSQARRFVLWTVRCVCCYCGLCLQGWH